MSRQDRKIDKKLLKFLQGELVSKEELAEVEDWIARNEKNKSYFREFQKLWEEKQFVDQLKSIDANRIWTGLQKKIKAKQVPSPIIPWHLKVRPVWRVAAVILLLMLPAATYLLLSTNQRSSVLQVSSMTRTTAVVLSDGSRIELNMNSTLNYPENLKRGKREVELSGEAFFQVTSRKNSSFIVHTGKSSVQVEGTSFNIREERKKIIVSVLSGEVLFFETGKKNRAISLEKGNQAIYHKTSGSIEKLALESENFLFWKTNTLTFRDQPLSQVFSELSNFFNTPIFIVDQAILLDRITTSCEGQQLQEILNEISLLHDLHFDRRKDTIYVQKKGP